MPKALLPGVIFLSILGYSVWLQRDAGFNMLAEHNLVVPALLADRPWYQIIFDVQTMEYPASVNNFEARELSYLFDYFDASAMVFAAKLGFAHALSTVKVLFSFCIAFLFWELLVGPLGLGRRLSLILTCLLLTSPPIMLWSVFHRTAKIGAGLFLLLSIRLSIELYRAAVNADAKRQRFIALTLFVSCVATTWFDPQGFFWILIGVIALSLERLFRADFALNKVLSVWGLSLFAHCFYKYYLGQRLILQMHGYLPGTKLQDLSFGPFFSEPVSLLRKSMSVVLSYYQNLLGSCPRPILIGLVVGILLFTSKSALGRKNSWRLTWVFIFIAQILLVAVQGAKYEWFFRFVHLRKMYYAIPVTIVAAMGIALFVRKLLEEFPTSKGVVTFFLALALVGNLASIPRHQYEIDLGSRGNSFAIRNRLWALRNWKDPKLIVPESLSNDLVYLSIRNRIGPGRSYEAKNP